MLLLFTVCYCPLSPLHWVESWHFALCTLEVGMATFCQLLELHVNCMLSLARWTMLCDLVHCMSACFHIVIQPDLRAVILCMT